MFAPGLAPLFPLTLPPAGGAALTVDLGGVLLSADVPAVLGSETLAELVESATGPLGLVAIFVYSFLIAFVLPGVSEVVLAAPLDIGPAWLKFAVIILVSGVGKAAGSVLAFHVGQGVKDSGPVERALRESRFDVVEWSERRAVSIARNYGFAGLAVALCVPGFPDTLSVYAFAVLEQDYVRFAAATFVGSVGRLLLVLGAFKGALVVA